MLLLLAITIPLGLDLYLPVPEANPLTAEKIELGRRLFFERRLSRDGSVACATCHDPKRAYSDARPVAIVVFGRIGRRNAPAIINRGCGRLFFWDGRASSLEEQVVKPIEDPNEMDLPLSEASARMGLAPEEIPARSRASFDDSRYDRFVNGDRTALSTEETGWSAIIPRQSKLLGLPRRPQFYRREAAQYRCGVERRKAHRRGSGHW